MIELGIAPNEIWDMTIAEYLLIVLHKSEIMEAEENERLGITDFGDDLAALDAALGRAEEDAAKGSSK